jgi:hypothetical protein
MRPHVSRDGRALREAPVTDLTTEWFLSRMGSYVGRQIGRLTKRFVAVTAPVRPLAGMGPHVGFERAGPCVRFTTNPAQVCLPLSGSA